MKASSNQEDINSKWKIPHQRHYFLLTSTKQRENKIITAVKKKEIEQMRKRETEQVGEEQRKKV